MPTYIDKKGCVCVRDFSGGDKILRLPIKTKWFYMIMVGDKKEEYREISKHWARRIISTKEEFEPDVWDELLTDLRSPYDRHNGPDDCLDYFGCKLKEFDIVRFKNGYQKNSPTGDVMFVQTFISTGKEKWGAEPGKYYFVITLGPVLK